MGSFLVLFSALVLVAFAIVSWPFRILLSGLLSRRRPRDKTTVRRVIVVGLDGLDPRQCERLIEEGKLPNLARLRSSGTSRPLQSTCPPISPVAWSTFLTGVN